MQTSSLPDVHKPSSPARRYGLLCALLLVLSASVAAYYLAYRPAGQPCYRGRCLESWLSQLEPPPASQGQVIMLPKGWEAWNVYRTPSQQRAADAVAAMGGSALPHLFRAITNRQVHLASLVLKVLNQLSPWEITVPSSGDKRRQAIQALGLFGQAAKPAIPDLLSQLDDPETQGAAVSTLVAIGPDAWEAVRRNNSTNRSSASALAKLRFGYDNPAPHGTAVSLLAGALTNLTDGPADVAQWALADFRGDREAVGLLTRALSCSDYGVRWGATVALGRPGTNAASAVPPLREMLRDPDARVRDHAGAALEQIEGRAVASLRPNPK